VRARYPSGYVTTWWFAWGHRASVVGSVVSPVVRPHEPWTDVLAEPRPVRARTTYPTVVAAAGLRLSHKGSGFTGVLARCERDGIVVRGVTGMERVFRGTPGAFEVDGRAVTLVLPKVEPRSASMTTASGSMAVVAGKARVARASRILVEGVHDAQLVERVWGDDLRVEGIVVERLDGLDHLAEAVADFGPGKGRRLGVLVDHLVPGSKEARLADDIDDDNVLVTGTPFVDVWEAVNPAVVGIAAWPQVPRGIDWKTGVCERLGVADPSAMWRRILASVNSYVDLAPALVGAVERLIDFVTELPEVPG
jgi:hypothetical protein